MIRRWMTRRRRKREMAEKLESTALKLEADLQETVDKLKEKEEEEELTEAVTVLRAKLQRDKEECKKMLRTATHVEEKEDESLYKSLFGMIVRDCIDTVMKREVLHLTMQMSSFRNSISRRMLTDETLTDETPLNILNVPKGFEEAWKVWKEQDKNECQEELSYQTLKSLLIE